MDEKNITDDKKLWTFVKPFLSDKTPFNAKITLADEDEINSRDNTTADILNTFLVIITNITDTLLKATLKYKNHPSTKATERVPKLKDFFKFKIYWYGQERSF